MSLAHTPESEPALEPVSLEEAKDFARIVAIEEDSYVETLITLARRYSEDRTGHAFITQTWKEYWDVFPDDGELRPSKSPVQSPITSIKYINIEGVDTTILAATYQVDYLSEPCRIRPAYNESWPDVRGDTLNAITVEFVAGYGAAASNVPERFKMAIKMLVAHWYNMREPTFAGPSIQQAPMAVDALLTGDKLWQF